MSVVSTAPELTDDQRQSALDHANRIRMYRAQLKRDIKAGANVTPFILDPPPEILKMKLRDLLLAVPRVGAVKADKVLWRCRIAPSKRLGGLTPRQRAEIAGLFLEMPG